MALNLAGTCACALAAARRGLAAGLALGLVLGAAPARSAPAMAPSELAPFVDGVMANGMAADHVAGATVAIVQSGRVVLVKGYGLARPGEAVDPRRDLFRIGSISKTFTWILLMRQVEAGRVRLDAPVNDYLPVAMRIPAGAFRRPILIRDLMSHSPGFEVVERNHLTVADAGQVIPLEAELQRHRPARVREPGRLASYSNYGAALAGYVVARQAGLPFEALADRDLIAPLGLTSTTFREPYPARPRLPTPMSAALAPRLATGFSWKDGGFQPGAFEYVTANAPAGSVSTTAPDMARYMLMQLAGGRLDGRQVYGPATALAFRTPILDTPPGVNGWAHGLIVRTLPGGYLSYGHGGSLDRFFSNLSLVPDLDLGVFISTNTSTGRRLAESLPKLIVQRFYAPAAILTPRPGDPALIGRAGLYAGRYITSRRAYHGLEMFADLMASHDRVWITPRGYLMTRLGNEVRAWVPDGPPGRFVEAAGSEILVFNRDARGRATGFPFPRGTYTAERAPAWLEEPALYAAAAAALAASMVILGDVLLRRRLRLRPTSWPEAAASLAVVVAALWGLAFAAFWPTGLAAGQDPPGAFPGPLLLTASWAGILAGAGTVGLLVLFILALADRPGAEGAWSPWRKAGYGLALVAFLGFAALLETWGALSPWG